MQSTLVKLPMPLKKMCVLPLLWERFRTCHLHPGSSQCCLVHLHSADFLLFLLILLSECWTLQLSFVGSFILPFSLTWLCILKLCCWVLCREELTEQAWDHYPCRDQHVGPYLHLGTWMSEGFPPFPTQARCFTLPKLSKQYISCWTPAFPLEIWNLGTCLCGEYLRDQPPKQTSGHGVSHVWASL